MASVMRCRNTQTRGPFCISTVRDECEIANGKRPKSYNVNCDRATVATVVR